jgi:hypothetical protein
MSGIEGAEGGSVGSDLVGQLSAVGSDLSRRALEAFALEEYKSAARSGTLRVWDSETVALGC